MQTISIDKITVGEIVTTDFRAAWLFKNAGIDFCCGGSQTLEKACQEKNISLPGLIAQLSELECTPIQPSLRYNDWDPGFLSDYIVRTHHANVLKSLPDLIFYTQKIATVHGIHHPELKEVAKLTETVNEELLPHLNQEETILFPAIKEALANGSSSAKSTIISEIHRMKKEHEAAGEALDTIRSITRDFLLPDDACTTYKLAFQLLKAFEDDLHIHVHLENNILFPKSLAI